MYNAIDKVLSAVEFINIIDGTLRNNPTYEHFFKHVEDQPYKSVVIDDVIINEDIHLTDTFNTNEIIYIWGGTFNGVMYLDKGVFENSFYICGGEFKSSVNLGSTHNSYISIYNASFSVLRFSGGYYKGWVSISGKFDQLQIGGEAVFNYIFTLEDCEAKSLILISDGYFKDKFEISGKIIAEKFRIGTSRKDHSNPFFINELHFINENPINITVVNNPIINYMYFKNITVHKDSKLYFSDFKINQIIFDNFSNHGYISFKDINKSNFKNTTLKMLRFPEKYRRKEHEDLIRPILTLTNNNNIKAKISIEYSNLGKIDFIGCNLNEFNFEFAYSKITEVFLAGTNMPDLISVPVNKSEEFYKQQRLGYSQIKKIYENRGDFVESGNYYAKEMDSYFKSLSYSENGWEKLNLLLSKVSSNYGQSWIKGLISSLIVSVFLFSLYCNSLGYKLSLPATDHTLNNFHEIESYLLEFMNPLHKADYIPEQLYIFENHTKLSAEYIIPRKARVLDVLSRIVIGYFLYQFVQAFRRYGKKSA
ncbi:hypothetical protein [Spirosoma radiotolerans]|uniref:Pentapeptide repeat-containing protein n=1 Tax=Spirosoma radiotolerans TaxID=1379870 RepID=A0A0E3ZTE1_9BACT|nr:hypothetical protein [Spirosoma radiotolerans]AKD53799.1 hypothetical protein SD10_01660 [Spirosoma radiotolerans]